MQLDSLFNFFELLNTIQRIQRSIFVKGTERCENDAEHQYQLALVAWYLITAGKLSYDLSLCIRYALVHDLIEAYAGDTYFYAVEKNDKAAREHAAAERLGNEFPECADMYALIAAYLRHTDPESRFISALDKLLPIVNNYLDGGRSWKAHGITREMIERGKAEKIAIAPEVKEIFDRVMRLLKEREEELFTHS